MPNFTKILIDGAFLSFFASIWLFLILMVNPRIFLHDYPARIQEKVPEKTKAEKLPYICFLRTFHVAALAWTIFLYAFNEGAR
jgi:hypothetical protein